MNQLIHAKISTGTRANTTTMVQCDPSGNLQTRIGGAQVPANAAGALIGLVIGRVLKTGSGTLAYLKITNTSASAQWYGIYDCTTVGAADGSANLLDVLQVGAATTVVYSWPLPFVTGCTVVNNGATEPHAANTPGSANSHILGICD